MKRIAAFLFAAAVASAGCGTGATGSAPAPGGGGGGGGGGQPAGAGAGAQATAGATAAATGDIRFTLTWTFDDRAVDPDFWTAGTFTTAGSLSRAFINAVTDAPTWTGDEWLSSGNQTFGDYHCFPEDQCLTPCTGSYGTVEWRDKPQIAMLERSGGHVVLHALLSAQDPQPDDESFVQTPDCIPRISGGMDGFPPMQITIDGLDGGAPLAMSVAWDPYEGTQPLKPGQVWDLKITPIP